MEQDFTYEYISHRGLQKDTLKFYDIKTKIDSEGKPIAVGFRYPWEAHKVRRLEEKEFYWEPSGVHKHGLYGRDLFNAGSSPYVTITEGEYDAASIYQTVGGPAVSVTSASAATRDVIADRDWVNSFNRIILAFDADTPGRNAVREVAKLFDYNKVYVVNFDKRKDANDFLQNGEEAELKAIWHNAKRYLPDTVVEIRKDNIKELLGERPKEGVAYPFNTVNQMTYGIRRGESVLLTAQEGVGKTELMHMIEYQLLKETNDAVGAIFLEEDKRDHLHHLAGIHLKKPVHLSDTLVTQDAIAGSIQDLIKVDGRLHLYNHFGSDDPEILLDTIRFMVTSRNVVYILLDHIGISVSGIREERDERRALDYLSTRLAMMIKELNFALILVSHVNDLGQTRGSRLIGKDCHVRIDAKRDVLALDDRMRHTVHLTISKNRPIGRTGAAGSYLFDPYTRQYTELGDEHGFHNSPWQAPINDNSEQSESKRMVA